MNSLAYIELTLQLVELKEQLRRCLADNEHHKIKYESMMADLQEYRDHLAMCPFGV